jgi:hypothetical protein
MPKARSTTKATRKGQTPSPVYLRERAGRRLDVYGLVVLDPREDEWRGFWLDVYGRRGVQQMQI